MRLDDDGSPERGVMSIFVKQVFFILFSLFASGVFSASSTGASFDVFWIDRYGKIPWKYETARLDNFAIQLMHERDQIGYVIVNAGLVSCAGEAQARAVRAKNYMVKVRGVPPDRIVWRDIGYGESFEISLWLAPAGKPPLYDPEFQSATAKHVIKKCVARPQRKSGFSK
jgi:hypothetical protein